MGDQFFGNDGFDDEFNEDFGEWPSPRPGPPGRGFKPNNDRYSNAYANYRGGYGPGGGFGPPMGGGPRMLRPPGPRFPPGPPGGPPMMWGRGFGPGGPPMLRNMSPENQAFRYLIRCGLSKEVVKSIPKQMILMMEPQYCGVCAMEFDSFAMSRMHYTSRNHAKNQKKWITQNMQFGESKNELPLKSRELYCELCDVHITSTTHAESHYAGKPHRSEQLIRREKKFMKAAPKAVQETAQAKPIQTDLYCDICKTSMTCSEQMTLHLNGKKHLSKEKQHIIRMMNGNAGAEKADEATAEGAPQDASKAPEEGGEGNPTEAAGDDGVEWRETWDN